MRQHPSLPQTSLRLYLLHGHAHRERNGHLVFVAVHGNRLTCLLAGHNTASSLFSCHRNGISPPWSCKYGRRAKLLRAAGCDADDHTAAKHDAGYRQDKSPERPLSAKSQAEQTKPKHSCECCPARTKAEAGCSHRHIGADGHQHRSRRSWSNRDRIRIRRIGSGVAEGTGSMGGQAVAFHLHRKRVVLHVLRLIRASDSIAEKRSQREGRRRGGTGRNV